MTSRAICAYRGCSNSYAKSPHLTFHKFPEKNAEKWITRCGNDDLIGLSNKQLKNKRLCSEHFDENAFSGGKLNGQGRRLNWNALPKMTPLDTAKMNITMKQDNQVEKSAISMISQTPKKRKYSPPPDTTDTMKNPTSKMTKHSELVLLSHTAANLAEHNVVKLSKQRMPARLKYLIQTDNKRKTLPRIRTNSKKLYNVQIQNKQLDTRKVSPHPKNTHMLASVSLKDPQDPLNADPFDGHLMAKPNYTTLKNAVSGRQPSSLIQKPESDQDPDPPPIICRLCGVSGPRCFSLLGAKAQNMKLTFLLEKYLDIEISSDEVLPLHICTLCSQTVTVFHYFNLRTQATAKTLKTLIRNNGTKKEYPWHDDNLRAISETTLNLSKMKKKKIAETTEQNTNGEKSRVSILISSDDSNGNYPKLTDDVLSTKKTTSNLVHQADPNNKVVKTPKQSQQNNELQQHEDWEDTIVPPKRDDKHTYVVRYDSNTAKPYYILTAYPNRLENITLTSRNSGIIPKTIYSNKVESSSSDKQKTDFKNIGFQDWSQHIIWLWQLGIYINIPNLLQNSADNILQNKYRFLRPTLLKSVDSYMRSLRDQCTQLLSKKVNPTQLLTDVSQKTRLKIVAKDVPTPLKNQKSIPGSPNVSVRKS